MLNVAWQNVGKNKVSYLEIGVCCHSLKRANDVQGPRARVDHFRLSGVSGTNKKSLQFLLQFLSGFNKSGIKQV